MTSIVFLARERSGIMRELTIHKNDADQRLDRFLAQGRSPAARLAGAEVHPPQAHQGQRSPRRARLPPARGRPSSSSTSTTSSLKRRARRTSTSPSQIQSCTSFTRMRTFCCSTSQPGLSFTPTRGRRSIRSSTICSPISTRSASGSRARKMPLPPRCATASTATRAASSSRQKTPRRCAS